MSWTLRITHQMLSHIRGDLARPHPHAAERVGFVYARMGNQTGPELQVLPIQYAAVADSDYIEDLHVGAKIGSSAIRQAMQTSLSGGFGVFHIHMHERLGRPFFSRVDLECYPDLVRGFRNVSPTLAHGALLLSPDSVECLVWLPRSQRPTPNGRIVVVGRPMLFTVGTGDVYA